MIVPQINLNESRTSAAMILTGVPEAGKGTRPSPSSDFEFFCEFAAHGFSDVRRFEMLILLFLDGKWGK